MTDPEVDELKDRETTDEGGDGGGGSTQTPDPSSGNGGGGGGLPVPRKYVALGVLVVVALAAYKLHTSGDGDASSSGGDAEELTGDVEAAEDDETGTPLNIPEGKGQKEKDAAVLDYLVKTDRMSG